MGREPRKGGLYWGLDLEKTGRHEEYRGGRVRTRDESESRTYVDHGRKNDEICAPIGDHGQQRD